MKPQESLNKNNYKNNIIFFIILISLFPTGPWNSKR